MQAIYFVGGGGGEGEVHPRDNLGPSSQENVSVPLFEHIYSSVLTCRQERTLRHYFRLQVETGGGRLECLGEECNKIRPTDVFYMHMIKLKLRTLAFRSFATLSHVCNDLLRN